MKSGEGEGPSRPQSIYTERDLHELWERQHFRREGLLTEESVPLAVEFPGYRWGEGGPDFRGARILLGRERRWGDVEMHLTPSGWDAHGHRRDGAYASVILHVVLRRDPFSEPPRGLPLLVLEPYLHGAAPTAAAAAGDADLDALGDEWFAERRARLERLGERLPADELLYREILVALGYKHNKAAMAELARRCPLASLGGGAGEIEARLRSEASAMPRAIWRLRNVRPANHPWRRLAGMARFLAASGGRLAEGLAARTAPAAMAAWVSHEGIGPSRATEIALNVFVPFLGPASWKAAAGGPAPGALPGLVERHGAGAATTVRRYFGALRLLKRRT